MISFEHIDIRRGSRLLLSDINQTLFARQRVGLVGANGCGKSSLLALLTQELEADQGLLSTPKQLRIAHVAQHTPSGQGSALDFVQDGDTHLRNIQKNLQQAMQADDQVMVAQWQEAMELADGFTAETRAARLLDGLGFRPAEITKPVEHFSGGWRMRLNLAQALMCPSELLLLDEPTNHLDLPAVLWLESWLKRYTGTLLLISHDREFLDALATDVWHIDRQTLRSWHGNYSAFEQQRAEQMRLHNAAWKKQQHKVVHLQQFIDRFRAKASKARQAQSRIKALQKLAQIAPAHIDSPFSFEFKACDALPHPMLDLRQVSLSYNEQFILHDVRLVLQPGDRIGLIGPNGAGKSTLIKLLAQQDIEASGEILIAEKLRIGYFAQHQLELLQADDSPLGLLQKLSPAADEQSLRDYLGGFGFVADQALARVEHFSGGERARLVLASIVWQQPNLLLLDEPTNHLDLDMREALTEALQMFSGAVVLVSHDRHLLRSCAEQLLLVDDGKVSEYQGSLDDYSDWLLKKVKSNRSSEDKSKGHEKKQQRQASAQRRKQRQPLKNKLKKTESRLQQLETSLLAIDKQLSDPQLYQDGHDSLTELTQKKSALQQQQEQLEEDWLNLSEALDTDSSEPADR
ncbi:MAG: ATP-binding cassette domain-containing protein [gamma proteobacterium symbiont of Bathyaustriella thionipta]|nr:ATP-binding cassette domain-containing protein [gamma proteobacterium symbiont of Bathyaustriella thionipta]